MTQSNRPFRIITLAALSLLVLAPFTVEAAGTITRLNVTPSPATVGTTVMIWVSGTGVCGELELDFDDGTAKAKLGGAFNLNTQHTYTQAGTFTLKANAKSDCQGQAQASHVVSQGGQITGLTVPPSASPNSQVPITVQGTGTCGSLELVFGDGSKATLPQATFPVNTQHPYTTTGSKTLKATAGTQCQGQAQATLQVKSLITDLCAKTDCGTLFCLTPQIKEFMFFMSGIPSSSVAMPGGIVVIKGCGFGSTAGTIRLVGSAPAFKLDAVSNQKQIIEWKDGLVSWELPMVTGVVDQPAMLQIKTHNNKESNEFPVNFKATQDIKQLPASHVQVSCSDESDHDSCNNVFHSDSSPFCSAPFVSGGGGTFSGYHWTCVGSSNGTDSFSASLKKENGWRFDHAALDDLSGSVFQTVTMSGFQSGSTSTNVSLKWNNAHVSYVLYSVKVSIVGPKGVPHK